MGSIWQWLSRLFPKQVRVYPEGKGYRVNGEWCATQVEVRRRLEELGVTESEIIRILKDLNTQKYGHPQR